jgi:hypothetical protein
MHVKSSRPTKTTTTDTPEPATNDHTLVSGGRDEAFTLTDLDLSQCTMVTGRFTGATFTGGARFDRATFTGGARFAGATFTDNAWFDEAKFIGDAWFDRTVFTRGTRFDGATLPSTRWVHSSSPSPSPWTDFSDARFDRGVPAEVAQFVTPPAAEQEPSIEDATETG